MKRLLLKILNVIKFSIKYILIPAVLVGGIVVTVFIIVYLAKSNDEGTRNQLLVGLATSIFSIVISANSIISSFANQTTKNTQKTKETTSIISIFNDYHLEDIMFIKQVINNANINLSYNSSKTPLIDSELNPAPDLPNKIDYAHYKAEIIKYSFYLLYSKPGVLSNDVIQHLSKSSDYSTNTIANIAVYNIFRQKRVALLNYFENLSIGISNHVTAGEILKSQFLPMLSKMIPLLLIFIYNEEKEDSYPALRALLLSWFKGDLV